MFSFFKKASAEERQMTSRSILELADKWWDGGYQKFYFKLQFYHHENGNKEQEQAAMEKREMIEKLLTESLRADNSGSLENKKIQEMIFVRVSTVLNGLEQIKVIAEDQKLPFRDLITGGK